MADQTVSLDPKDVDVVSLDPSAVDVVSAAQPTPAVAPASPAAPTPNVQAAQRHVFGHTFHGEPVDDITGAESGDQFKEAMGAGTGGYGAYIPHTGENAPWSQQVNSGAIRFLSQALSPKSAAETLGLMVAGEALPAAANLPAAAKYLKDFPAVLKALDVTAKAAIPGATAAMGVKNLIQGGLPKNIEDAVVAAGNALMTGVGLAGAIQAGKATLANYPKTPESSVSVPGTAEKIPARQIGGIPTPSAETATAKATALESQGQRLAAQAWKNINVKAPTEIATDAGTVYLQPADVTVKRPYYSVHDANGKVVVGGTAATVRDWLNAHTSRVTGGMKGGATSSTVVGGPNGAVSSEVSKPYFSESAQSTAGESTPAVNPSEVDVVPGETSVSAPPEVNAADVDVVSSPSHATITPGATITTPKATHTVDEVLPDGKLKVTTERSTGSRTGTWSAEAFKKLGTVTPPAGPVSAQPEQNQQPEAPEQAGTVSQPAGQTVAGSAAAPLTQPLPQMTHPGSTPLNTVTDERGLQVPAPAAPISQAAIPPAPISQQGAANPLHTAKLEADANAIAPAQQPPVVNAAESQAIPAGQPIQASGGPHFPPAIEGEKQGVSPVTPSAETPIAKHADNISPESKPATPEVKSVLPHKETATYDEIQNQIDAKETEYEKRGMDPMKMFGPKTPRLKSVNGGPLDMPGWIEMPADLADLYRRRDAIQDHEDVGLNSGLNDALNGVVPDPASREKLVKKLSETDLPPAIRGAHYGYEQWRDLGRIANDILHFAREEAGDKDSFTHIESRLAGTAENPGHQLVLLANHGTTRYPSSKIFDRAQAIFRAVLGENAPELPRPGKVSPEVKLVLPPKEETREEEAPYKYSSTQVNLPSEFHKAFTDAAAGIPDSDLDTAEGSDYGGASASTGRETDPHITVLYGLHATEPAAVKKLLADQGPITATLGKVSIFKGKDADVVKIDINSPELHALNAKLRKLEHTNDYPDYTPHLTLAYVKSGEGEKYVGKSSPGLTGKTVTFNRVMFSGKDQSRTDIPLKAETKKPITMFRGAESPELGKGDFGGTFLATDEKTAAQYGVVRKYNVSAHRFLGIDDQEAGTLSAQFLNQYPGDAPNYDPEEEGEPAHELWLFPTSRWIQFLKSKGYEGTAVGKDRFVFDQSHVSLAEDPKPAEVPDLRPAIRAAMGKAKDLNAQSAGAKGPERDRLAELASEQILKASELQKEQVRNQKAKVEAAKPKKPTLDERAKADQERLKTIYTPGNIITGYGGQIDKVISFKQEPSGRFSVTVQEYKTRNGTLIPDAPQRTHSTPPGKNAKVIGHVEPPAPKNALPESDVRSVFSNMEFDERTPQLAEKAVQSERGQSAAGEKSGQAIRKPGGSGNSSRYGQAVAVRIPSENRSFESRYAIRELEDVIPSHNPFNLQANPDYKFRNDRNYSDPRNAERILKQTSEFDPEYVVTESPDANNGAPVIDSAGNVLGGNSRAMTIARVYKQKPQSAIAYKALLEQKAAQFGLTREEVAAMKQPVLVRELIREVTPESAQDIITDLNKVGTAALTGSERAIADSNRISTETLEQFAGMIDSIGASGTLAKALEGKAGAFAANLLVKDGVITTSEKPTLFSANGDLTTAAKERIAKLMLGRLFDDSAQLESATPSLRGKLERIVAPLSRIAGKPEWDLLPDVKSAIQMVEMARATGNKNLDDLVAQQGLFGGAQEYSPRTVSLAKFINDTGPVKIAAAFNRYANDSRGPTMFGEVKPDEAFTDAFENNALSAEAGQSPALNSFVQYLADKLPDFKRDPEEAEENYSGLGAARTRFVRGLGQTEKANEAVHAAAVRTASHQAISSAILQKAIPQIKAALKPADRSWEEFALALIQSRLFGIRDRWQDFADQAREMSDDEITESFSSAFTGLLKNIEGKAGIPQNVTQTATAQMEAGAIDTLRDFLVETFEQAADSVAEVLDKPLFDELTDEPAFKKALSIYKNLVETPMAASHAENEGVFSNALGPLDAYYPLIPVLPADKARVNQVAGKRVPYRKPRNTGNSFATGLSAGYSETITDFREGVERSIRQNAKAALLETLRNSGLMRDLSKNEEMPETFNYQGRDFTPIAKEVSKDRTLFMNGKVIHVPATMAVMPKWLWRELHPILESEDPITPTMFASVMKWINKLSLAGPADFVFHASNLLGTLVANTPWLDKSIEGKALSVPFVKKFYAISKLVNTDVSSEEFADKIRQMAEAGVLPSRYGSVTHNKAESEETGAELRPWYDLGPMLYGQKGLDIRARVLMWDIAKAINPNATKKELYLFVNQLGNYTGTLQSEIERGVKKSGLSMFYTAGSTMLRNGINSWTGKGPMPKSMNSPLGTMIWKLMAGAIGTVALWMLAYRAMTGKAPWKDERMKFMQIPVGNGHGPVDGFRHSAIGTAMWGKGGEVGYINFGFFNPIVSRGARAMGISAAAETLSKGGSAGQAAEAASVGTINALAQPVLGPPLRDGFVLTTGMEPYLTNLRDRRGAHAPQFFPAIPPRTKPGAADFAKRAAAAFLQTNAFYGAVGEGTGFIGPGGNEKGIWWLQMVTDYALPGIRGTASNPYASATILRQQRNGTR